ncbi:MAG: hypothetical protein H6567_13585 [Lewinellaceae bacterium]|nr:hypothetical protein [Lewinellaceae bacterium]
MKQHFKKKYLFIAASNGLVLSLPVTGFVFGFISCSDCENSISGFLGRLFIGLVYLVLNTFSLGQPLKNESGGSSYDLRFYTFICALCISILVFLTIIIYRKFKKTAANRVDGPTSLD